jgi:hypothetical protein
MRIARLLFAALTFIVIASTAHAHSQSYGYLRITIGETSVDGNLGLAVRDLDTLHDLDANRDGKITWGEFRVRETEIANAILHGISIVSSIGSCNLTPKPALTDSRGGETYIIVPFGGACSALDGRIDLSYQLLFNIDAQHRGLVSITSPEGMQSFVMVPGATVVSFEAADGGWVTQFLTYVKHGARHIWLGYDHILFLLTLLLGSASQARAGSIAAAMFDSVKVITAFTLSHALALGLASFGALRVPVPVAESLVAVTIALAAANNIRPFLSRRIWLVALVFGLIHGIGFTSVLLDLGLSQGSLLMALLAFNTGVELGQLAVVVAAFPFIALVMRMERASYGLAATNLTIATFGVMWFSDRALGTALMPF